MFQAYPLAEESLLSTSETNITSVDIKQSSQTSFEDMRDFRRVANEATRGLMASEEKSRQPPMYAMCAEPYSTWRCMCLVMLMVCFVAATPLSLLLTIPAYILADRAEILSQQGFKRESCLNCLISVILNLAATAIAMTCLGIAMFLYIYLASHR
ncbi:hypothetical protein GBAR_LOCUS19450 [Geodia barretti]|uniref:Uncharacterized protein n=1 Tax=Geodia barretti TaxID=519541 RepID=A0AA35SS23_GEOBA|nr:hypothetical protein GBAR_LOCUS19450 [Geodia barretti]